eukprot:scaffold442242_cov16-Prasinocladus_malaysianus.AAC.3
MAAPDNLFIGHRLLELPGLRQHLARAGWHMLSYQCAIMLRRARSGGNAEPPYASPQRHCASSISNDTPNTMREAAQA